MDDEDEHTHTNTRGTLLFFFWLITLIASMVGAIILIIGLRISGSAPQEASVAAIAIAIAALPYIFTKAVEGMSST